MRAYRGGRPCPFACVHWARRSPVLPPCCSPAAPRSSSRSAASSEPPPAQAAAAPLPASIPAADLVGRWGLAAYHKEEDRGAHRNRGARPVPAALQYRPRPARRRHHASPRPGAADRTQPERRAGRQELHRPRRRARRAARATARSCRSTAACWSRASPIRKSPAATAPASMCAAPPRSRPRARAPRRASRSGSSVKMTLRRHGRRHGAEPRDDEHDRDAERDFAERVHVNSRQSAAPPSLTLRPQGRASMSAD